MQIKWQREREDWKGEWEIIPCKRRAAGSGKPISLRSRRIFFWMSVSGGGSGGSWWRCVPWWMPSSPGLWLGPPDEVPLSAPSPHPVPHPFHYSVLAVLGARNEWEEGRAWNCTRESEWLGERGEIDIRKTPRCPPSIPPNPGRRGGSVWRWHPSVYPRSGVGKRRGRQPGWNGRAGLPRTLGSTKRTSAPVNYPLRRPLAEFMRPPLEEVSRLLWRLRRGVGTTRADRSLAIGEFYERLHWQLDGTFSTLRHRCRRHDCDLRLQIIF